MKRVYILLLVLLLVLTGCTGKVENNDISVKDVRCPYEIKHEKAVAVLTLQDGEQSGILWQVEAVPNDICEVTQDESKKEYTSQYRITGAQEGAAQLTFTASQPDETVVFVLTFIVNVDAENKVTVSSNQHRESANASVEANGLNYKWNVDVNGVLTFSLINSEDKWLVSGDGGDVCTLMEMMSTPVGCQFSAEAKTAGQTAISLVGETTQRQIQVVIQVDDNGVLGVVSVQER